MGGHRSAEVRALRAVDRRGAEPLTRKRAKAVSNVASGENAAGLFSSSAGRRQARVEFAVTGGGWSSAGSRFPVALGRSGCQAGESRLETAPLLLAGSARSAGVAQG